MFVIYADTPEEFRQSVVEHLEDQYQTALANVTQYRTQKERHAQQARAMTYLNMKLFIKGVKIASNADYEQMKANSRPAFPKEN